MNEADKLRKQILDALPMRTELETAFWWHLKDQPAKFWEELDASYDPSPKAAAPPAPSP